MLKVYLDASTKGNPGPSGGGLLIVGEDLMNSMPLYYPRSQITKQNLLRCIMLLNFSNERMARPDDHALYRQ